MITVTADSITVHTGNTDPPPPPPSGILWGASANGRTTHADIGNAEVNWALATVGSVPVLRTHDDWFPATWQDAKQAKFTPGTSIAWYSFRPDVIAAAAGTLDSAFDTFLASIPTASNVWLSLRPNPEAEVAKAYYTATQWRQAQSKLKARILAAGRGAKIKLVPLLDASTLTNPARLISDYETNVADLIGWSIYNTAEIDSVSSYMSIRTEPWAVGEYAAIGTFTDAAYATRLRNDATKFMGLSKSPYAVCYFHRKVGGNDARRKAVAAMMDRPESVNKRTVGAGVSIAGSRFPGDPGIGKITWGWVPSGGGFASWQAEVTRIKNQVYTDPATGLRVDGRSGRTPGAYRIYATLGNDLFGASSVGRLAVQAGCMPMITYTVYPNGNSGPTPAKVLAGQYDTQIAALASRMNEMRDTYGGVVAWNLNNEPQAASKGWNGAAQSLSDLRDAHRYIRAALEAAGVTNQVVTTGTYIIYNIYNQIATKLANAKAGNHTTPFDGWWEYYADWKGTITTAGGTYWQTGYDPNPADFYTGVNKVLDVFAVDTYCFDFIGGPDDWLRASRGVWGWTDDATPDAYTDWQFHDWNYHAHYIADIKQAIYGDTTTIPTWVGEQGFGIWEKEGRGRTYPDQTIALWAGTFVDQMIADGVSWVCHWQQEDAGGELAVRQSSMSFGGRAAANNKQAADSDSNISANDRAWQDVDAVSGKNVRIASPGGTIGGVSLSGTKRVLLKDQTDRRENGIYVWTGASTPMTRASDADTAAKLKLGGIRQAKSDGKTYTWFCINSNITVGDTEIEYKDGLNPYTTGANLGQLARTKNDSEADAPEHVEFGHRDAGLTVALDPELTPVSLNVWHSLATLGVLP